MVGKKNPHATIRVQDLMDIIQEADSLYDKEENNIVGDEDSDGYEKLMELVKEYTDMICSRGEHATETLMQQQIVQSHPQGGAPMHATIKIPIPHQAQRLLLLKEHKEVQLLHQMKCRILLERNGICKKERGRTTVPVERKFGEVW